MTVTLIAADGSRTEHECEALIAPMSGSSPIFALAQGRHGCLRRALAYLCYGRWEIFGPAVPASKHLSRPTFATREEAEAELLRQIGAGHE